MKKDDIVNFNIKMVEDMKEKVVEYSQDENEALLCQDVLIRCHIELNKLFEEIDELRFAK